MLDKLDSGKLRSVVPGSWEEQVESAAKQSANRTLGINLAGTGGVGFYTLATDEGDVLVVRWNGPVSGRPERAVWLWDTPFYTTFVMEVSPSMLQGDEFLRYCEGLFVWDKDPIDFKSLSVVYLVPDADKQWILGGLEYAKTALGVYHTWLAGKSDRQNAFVAVGMSKPIFFTLYPADAYQVRERFPPLAQRLGSVPKQALFDELGKGYASSSITSYPTNRDAIIARELLSRGPLSDADLRQVIMGNFDKGDALSGLVINSRVIAFVTAVRARNQLAAYGDALGRVFLAAPILRGLEDAVIGHVFGAMEKDHVDFCGPALAFLERDRYSRQSLLYLEHSVHDSQTLQRLSATAVKPELEREKKIVIDNIKRRLASNP